MRWILFADGYIYVLCNAVVGDDTTRGINILHDGHDFINSKFVANNIIDAEFEIAKSVLNIHVEVVVKKSIFRHKQSK